MLSLFIFGVLVDVAHFDCKIVVIFVIFFFDVLPALNLLERKLEFE